MALVEVFMPKFGMTMEAGIITQWLVNEGDVVTEGQALATVETEKVNVDIESPASGTIAEISYAVEAEVEVGKVIAYIETA
jgi:pyruvate/2-oxoglutarate dehydrogenase complex dihydrolipoamide acyltransferase (E2) component